MKQVRIGQIGLGDRGKGLLKDIIIKNKKADVVAVCDEYADGVKAALDIIKEARGKEVFSTSDYREVINRKDVDLVLVTGAWETHIPYSIAAMEAGKDVAMEVGGAYDIEQCWELVHTSERTGKQCMLLENCCYGKRELMIKNMVDMGLFGTVVHCNGGYMHDLRDILWRYRIRNYSKRCAENYPTHEIGPIAKILKINRGNRMVSLVSVASKAQGYHEYVLEKCSDEKELVDMHVAQGDIVTTIIKCAGGETITIQLDTTLPRPYSRGFTVRGTKGMYQEDSDMIFFDGQEHESSKPYWGNAKEYEEKYLDPIWTQYKKDGVQGTHGGMDWLLFDRLFDCCIQGRPFEIDVYDAASWMSITALSEQSILLGGAPVAIPDFTCGKWMWRE